MAESASNVEDLLVLLPLEEDLRGLFDLRKLEEVLPALSEPIAANSHQLVAFQPEETKLEPACDFPHLLALQNHLRVFYLVHDLLPLRMLHTLDLVFRRLPASIHVEVIYIPNLVPVAKSVCWNPHPIPKIFSLLMSSILMKVAS